MFNVLLFPQYGPAMELPGQRRPAGSARLRLDYQRDFLEYKKMSHADLMQYFPYRTPFDSDLERRRQFLEARGEMPSLGYRLRQALGRFLIATGERIRTESAVVEQRSNA